MPHTASPDATASATDLSNAQICLRTAVNALADLRFDDVLPSELGAVRADLSRVRGRLQLAEAAFTRHVGALNARGQAPHPIDLGGEGGKVPEPEARRAVRKRRPSRPLPGDRCPAGRGGDLHGARRRARRRLVEARRRQQGAAARGRRHARCTGPHQHGAGVRTSAAPPSREAGPRLGRDACDASSPSQRGVDRHLAHHGSWHAARRPLPRDDRACPPPAAGRVRPHPHRPGPPSIASPERVDDISHIRARH